MTDRVVLAHSGGLDTSLAIDQSLAGGFVDIRGLPGTIASGRDLGRGRG